MPAVTLEPAGHAARETLANLFQLYTHDFSEHWSGTPQGALAADGRFAPYPELDSYLGQDPSRAALLIRTDGELAGFALINASAHSGLPVDFNLAELFVARKHRRAGVGRAAAVAIIAARPGRWEVAVARRNTGALAFWRCVAAAAAVGGAVDSRDQNDERWNGTILRFG